MGLTVVRAEQQHVDGICRVCADGWRETYAGILPDEEIEATIEEFYTPVRVEQEVRSPEDWDGWLVALDDEEVVGAGGGGLTEPTVGEVFVLYVDPAEKRRGIGSRLLDVMTEQHERRHS
ncbi:GNAT family N-acetyltransferase [Haloarchaeobius sp. TZWWS8]|uniref:GNAT family N-acetyltransferase n=1 Tax=Haloarchaeobius sp. TZWWS8 TaxID=3446121 RepID=UPI003EBA955C